MKTRLTYLIAATLVVALLPGCGDSGGADGTSSDTGDIGGDTTSGDTTSPDTDNCTPDCTGRCAGDDGCGGQCPADGCEATGQTCSADTGLCEGECQPLSCDALGAVCGDHGDGCGGAIACGSCSDGESCTADGQCVDGCEPTCDGTTWGGDDGCGGECTCPAGFEPEPGGTCVERDVSCIRIDRTNATVIPPAGVKVVFRLLDCTPGSEGLPIRRLQLPPDTPDGADILRVINEATGEDFNESSEGGSRSGIATPSDFGLYAMLALDMSNSIVADGVAGDVLDAAETFIRATVEEQPPELRHNVGLMVFGRTSEIAVVEPFTDDPAALYARLDELRGQFTGADAVGLGSTNLFGAYTTAIDEVAAQGADVELVERSVLILTDGRHEAGAAEELLAESIAARDDAVEQYGLNAFSVYVSGSGCADIDPEVDTELSALATNDQYFVCADGAASLGDVFTNLADNVEAIANSNYAVAVCTPVELGDASLTLEVELDGASGAPTATGSQTVAYSTDQLTGDVGACNAAHILDPCDGLQCGPGHIAGFACGTCDGGPTNYCTSDGQCADACAGRECGLADAPSSNPDLEISCGSCDGETSFCAASGMCEDACADRECGDVNVPEREGGTRELSCGTCSGDTTLCSATGQCTDACSGLDCGFGSVETSAGIEEVRCGPCSCDTTACCDAIDSDCDDWRDVDSWPGECVSTETDLTNCGGCGITCPAGAGCEAGECVCPEAMSTDCDGVCTDLGTDRLNCGECGNACPPSEFAWCNAGECECFREPDVCGSFCTDIRSDRSNCGRCGNACARRAICIDGACECPRAEEVCGDSCVDTVSSVDNCGGCDNLCADGQICSGGSCIWPLLRVGGGVVDSRPEDSEGSTLSTGHFNADDYTDVIWTFRDSFDSSLVSTYLGGTDRSRIDVSFVVSLLGRTPYHSTTGDVDGDTFLDLVTVNRWTNGGSVFVGDGTGRLDYLDDFSTTAEPWSVTAAVLGDTDDDLDLIVTYGDTEPPTALLGVGVGSGMFGTPTQFGPGAGATSATTTDLNGDGRTDVIVAIGGSELWVGLGNATSPDSWDSVATYSVPVSEGQDAVAAADINNDGHPDVIVASTTDSGQAAIAVFAGDGTGTLTYQGHFLTYEPSFLEVDGPPPSAVAVGEFTGDAYLDVVTRAWAYPYVQVLPSLGDGTLGVPSRYRALPDFGAVSILSIAVGDLDNDGHSDVVTLNGGSSDEEGYFDLSILYGTGGEAP